MIGVSVLMLGTAGGCRARPTCAAVQLVLDGVLDLQLDVLWHVLAVCNVPASEASRRAGTHLPAQRWSLFWMVCLISFLMLPGM